MNNLSLYENVPAIENNFTIKVRLYVSTCSLFSHWHEHIEIIYITKGSCDFICNGKSFVANKGDFVFVNSTEVHSFVAKETLEYICILIYPDFFSDIKNSNVVIQNLIRNDDYIKNCMYDIYNEYENNLQANDMMIKSYSYKLMAYLVRNYTMSYISKEDIDNHNDTLERLNMLLEYISEHYSDKITTSYLAHLSYLSESHLCRFFKKSTGKSFVQYINEYRIEKASVLLKNTNENISSIASSVGFEDINYFSRTFKKITGKTPTSYRNSET